MIEFTINLETPSGNTRERQHWRAQRRDVTTWEKHFIAIMHGHRIPRCSGIHRRVALMSWRRRRCSDEANLVFGFKACIDGMVRAGLIADDSIALATFTYSQEVASKSPTGRPCTHFTITDQPNETP